MATWLGKRLRDTMRNRRSRSRGQSMVDFALTLPMFMFMIAASIELGWAFNAFITVTSISRDGARQGISMTNATICNLVAKEGIRLTSTPMYVVITRTVDSGTTNNQSVDVLNASSSCACTDVPVLVSSTSSGHKLVSTGSATERSIQVEVQYNHHQLLGMAIDPLPQSFAMDSVSKFPVAPYYTSFTTTGSC